MTIEERIKALNKFCTGNSCTDCILRPTGCDWEECGITDETIIGYYNLAFPPDTEETPTEAKEDLVNHPSHYTNGGMECIEEMELIFGIEFTMHFCLLNAWKYRRRALYKNGQQDMDKSHWYINKYKELKVKYNEQLNVRLKSI